MADSNVGSRPLASGAERMNKIAQGVKVRHTVQVRQGNIPQAPSTLYRRVDKAGDFHPEISPRIWPSTPPIKNNWVAEAKAWGQSNWRRYMPWPVRWVMGWP